MRDLPGDVEAALARHRIVEDDQVGTQGPRHRERRRSIAGLADDRDLALGGEQRANALADGLMIVGDENANHGPALPSSRKHGRTRSNLAFGSFVGFPLAGEPGTGGLAEGA